MSFFQNLAGLASGGGNNTNTQAPGATGTDTTGTDPSNSQLLSSSEALFNAARGQGNVSNAQLADDAGNLLQGVDNYAKLNNTPYGNYFQEASGYLQKYGESAGGGGAGTAAAAAPGPPGNTTHPPAAGAPTTGAGSDPISNSSDPSQNAPQTNYSDPSQNNPGGNYSDPSQNDPSGNYSDPSQNDPNANYSDPSQNDPNANYSDQTQSGPTGSSW